MTAVRPERIDQLIPAIIEHDAVSNHTFEAQRLLRELGFESEIYAGIIGPGAEGRVERISELPERADGRQWLLYQSSIGSPVAEVFARHAAPKLLDYHNITPAALVERWIAPLADESRLGRRQLGELAPLVHGALADSSFNAEELVATGFQEVRVVPVLIDAANLEAEPEPRRLAALAAAKSRGGSDWLFVGQLGAHKAQHDVIKAFSSYRRLYDPAARLHLVGREMGHAYADALRRFIATLHLADAVSLPGSVSPAELVAYYQSADVFVCCSDHEGYCAPIIEAMARGLPVVAYRAGAVPDTVGAGGVLLDDKHPVLVAAAVDEVLRDDAVRERLAAAARRQAARHTLARAREAFCSAIEGHLARPVQKGFATSS
jgi:glycosyltransferase involved in cell wall biosynthesis